MQILEAGDWSLLLPPEWIAEEDGETIVIGDRDGVGSLEISELRKAGGNFNAADLADFDAGGEGWEHIRLGNFEGTHARLVEDGVALREWYLYVEDLLLYLTYSCAVDNQGMDDSAVDDILTTLRFARAE